MRRQGVVCSAAGLIPFGHLGWGYRDHAEFRARAGEYVADGLAGNQWILYVGDAGRQALRAELADAGFGDALKSGQIEVMPVADYYMFLPGSDVIDPEAMLATGAAVLERVLANGYSGCRAVVDGTAMARRPEQRDALARLEYLIDQEMTESPVSALCAYDVNALGEVAKEMLCLHPFVSEGAVGFRLYAEEGVGFALAGEIDAADNDAFTAALHRIWPLAAGGELIIGVRSLDFVTHHQLITLDEYARADGRDVVLRTDRPMVARLAGLLALQSVRVQPPPMLVADAC